MTKRVLRRHARERFERYVSERTARRGESDAAYLRQILTHQALPKSVVLAVNRAKTVPRPARQAADEVTRRDEYLFVRERDPFAVLERGDGRAKGRDPGRGDEDQVRVGVCGERDEGLRAERRARGRKFHGELAQAVGVLICPERDDAKAIRMRADYIERLPPDGSGRAEDRDPCG
jgi:hypothetical protein